jgi:hypothetical protein
MDKLNLLKSKCREYIELLLELNVKFRSYIEKYNLLKEDKKSKYRETEYRTPRYRETEYSTPEYKTPGYSETVYKTSENKQSGYKLNINFSNISVLIIVFIIILIIVDIVVDLIVLLKKNSKQYLKPFFITKIK